MSFKPLFSRSLSADPTRLHLAAHSHHLWPDASFDGHMQAWQDAATLADRKWTKIFSDIWPRAQRHIARELATDQPEAITFSSSTHDFLVRLLSSFANEKPIRVLTTDSEFYSFSRQIERYAESGRVQVTTVAAAPFASLEERLAHELDNHDFDFVFVSQVLFNAGLRACDPVRLTGHVRNPETMVVFDGYHSFMAVPVEFGALRDRAFFLSGGYKYAMSGEGVCFIHAPRGYAPRPEVTGWFASFGALSTAQKGPAYSEDAGRLLGSTFDPTAIYRFVHVMDMLQANCISTAQIHQHSAQVATRFVEALKAHALPFSERDLVVQVDNPARGQFLAFEFAEANLVYTRLLEANIITDVRGNRLRFGFSLYHDVSEMQEAVERIALALT